MGRKENVDWALETAHHTIFVHYCVVYVALDLHWVREIENKLVSSREFIFTFNIGVLFLPILLKVVLAFSQHLVVGHYSTLNHQIAARLGKKLGAVGPSVGQGEFFLS